MTGEDLVRAIENNATLMELKDCPSVPIQMSCAVYGKVQIGTLVRDQWFIILS
ncbi:hypothetical protein SAMN03159324_00696 [Pseudomonas sp. NFPP18]|nr:hypothetical protein SAMN03159460_00509 [Pseudomonas sp. NFPP17]SDA43363.1 hypothetical protein SAMN03159464_00691 [Pseudomonas sp. NFPP15]SEK33190.1 hypothetical protein SAMN03159324_00696 [Pseudomonas sp. NFPP18]SFA43394.1 hypothetical protein SAMN03159320_00509 [Pseudomonas sp. NFPP13]SFT45951.1 hypothetical protein SAMN03159492_00689 [Pseudomonas sp. NFPP25]SFX11288.1 hypothetical protein SAMN03159327_0836 [Pseudomonas sp. NFPP16]SFX18756.1 hypothetical protein SAMN03159345_0834 [Pseud